MTRFKLVPFATVLGLATILSLSLTGCNPPAESETNGTQPTGNAGTAEPKADILVGIVFDKGGRGDQSFNDSAFRGIQRAEKELGITMKAVDSKTDADYETNIRAMAEAEADLVIGVGYAMKNAIDDVAKEFPDTKFALVDSVSDLPNVRSVLFKEEEGSFLAGYLAAKVSKTKKVGFVGGKDGELIRKFYAGYAAGVKYANAGVEVLPPKFTDDWDNQDIAKAAANVLYGNGADIVYHAAGRAGLGVIAAAKDKNLLAIGVDSNQDHIAKGNVLTSMIKRVDESVFQTIQDVQGGTFTPGIKVYDLAGGGVGLSEFEFTQEMVTPDMQKGLDEIEKLIVNGTLKIPATDADLAAFTSTEVAATP
ncbi:MAG: BMP family ABC transporter substrate-binding protein [Fimbriimonadaceae bacterium]|nr:BMP family ABC transporter substrate-binding protein [Fimbriimonadaceae bacterium]